MAIEVRSTKGAAKTAGVKILICGPSGSGKTSIFRTTGKTLVISAEGGDLSLNDVEVDSIRIKSLADLKEAYQYIVDNTDKYDTVGIDSISEIGETIVAELQKDPEYNNMKDSMKLWMQYSKIMLAIAKSFRDLDNINVVVLALIESVKSGFDEKVMPLIPAKKVQAKLQSLYDVVALIQVDDEGNRNFICSSTQSFDAKDRSDNLNSVEPYTKKDGIAPLFKKVLDH